MAKSKLIVEGKKSSTKRSGAGATQAKPTKSSGPVAGPGKGKGPVTQTKKKK